MIVRKSRLRKLAWRAYASAMDSFPRPSANPHGVEPKFFGCAFAQFKEADDEKDTSILCCAYGLDPKSCAPERSWPEPWGVALQMCDWNGGRLDSHGLVDFAVFGQSTWPWLARAGFETDMGWEAKALAIAEATIEYHHRRHKAPKGRFSSLAWITRGSLVPRVLADAETAKRLIWAQWEADQLSTFSGIRAGTCAVSSRL